MKDRDDAILRPAQAAFLESLRPEPDALLAEMEELSHAEDIPSSDPEVGRLLEILAGSMGAERILEVGTAIGYGALRLARGAPAARIWTIDPDAERLETARRFLERDGSAERVELVEGEALDVLPDLLGEIERPLDLVYLDAIKTEYRDYVETLLPKMRFGGLFVIDNLLWKGWVADPPPDAARDERTEAIRDFDHFLVRHPRLHALILPLGDGVGLATVTV